MSADIEIFSDEHRGVNYELSLEIKAQGWINLGIENSDNKYPEKAQYCEVSFNLQEEDHRAAVKNLINHLQHCLNIWEEDNE